MSASPNAPTTGPRLVWSRTYVVPACTPPRLRTRLRTRPSSSSTPHSPLGAPSLQALPCPCIPVRCAPSSLPLCRTSNYAHTPSSARVAPISQQDEDAASLLRVSVAFAARPPSYLLFSSSTRHCPRCTPIPPPCTSHESSAYALLPSPTRKKLSRGRPRAYSLRVRTRPHSILQDEMRPHPRRPFGAPDPTRPYAASTTPRPYWHAARAPSRAASPPLKRIEPHHRVDIGTSRAHPVLQVSLSATNHPEKLALAVHPALAVFMSASSHSHPCAHYLIRSLPLAVHRSTSPSRSLQSSPQFALARASH
ncbi:hypothetical protein DFH09DRAFT_1500125 [Mycena vulgaris]|nr:hypothetical protein DFH09DRAFT_1500125 [Mycena vulgaris]